MSRLRRLNELKDTIPGHHVSTRDFPNVRIDDLPEEVLVIILTCLPEPFLFHVAPEVSRKWKDLCQRPTLWRQKCLREGVKIPKALPQEYCDYHLLLLKNPFGRNLLKNWDRSDGFIVKDITAAEWYGRPPLSELIIGTTNCWALSDKSGLLTKVIDFLEEGLSAEILDELQPAIQVSVWTEIGHVRENHSMYHFFIELLDEQGQSLNPEVEFRHEVNQTGANIGGNYQGKISHAFRNYGRGVRQLRFRHRCAHFNDYSGSGAIKIAAPCVRLELED